MPEIKVIAMDLDGTLTQHRSPLPAATIQTLDRLREKYRLLMVGAGMAQRIHRQMEGYPVDIIGNYGMQYAIHDRESGELRLLRDDVLPCDRASMETRVTALRQKHGYTEFTGENVEFHSSGCVTIPLLGTAARLEDKLAFDPDRRKRRAIYEEVKELFPEYVVFVGGSSSFDLAPRPYDKAYALEHWCREEGLTTEQVVYVGDDYGPGGNDEAVYRSAFRFVPVDDYRQFPQIMETFL